MKTSQENFLSPLKQMYGLKRGNLYASLVQESIAIDDPIDPTIIEQMLIKKPCLDEGTINRLQALNHSSDETVSPHVKKARKFLREYLENDKQYRTLRADGYATILYGSLQYNDPRNCDADLNIVHLWG